MKNPKQELQKTFNESNTIDRNIYIIKKEIQAMSKNKFFNRSKIKKASYKLQALEEAQRDILNPGVTQFGGINTSVVDKNNYKTYEKKVSGAYEMYDSNSDYGGEICRGVVDTRISFIGGEGLSIISKNKKKQEFIDDFLQVNDLNGSRLMDMLTIGELEGKNLILLLKGTTWETKDGEKERAIIKVRSFSWNQYKYTVNSDAIDKDQIKSITYRDKKENSIEKTISEKQSVFVKLGGMNIDINKTTSKLHCILTDIENFSRAKYDLRSNTHLFGKYTLYWKCQTAAEAKSINNQLQAQQWEPGTAFAGTAEMNLIEPGGGAAESIIKDMLIALKNISLTLGIPIHFLAWPELMSNRATAENLMELVVASTRKDRLVWEEKIKELIQKAIIMAIEDTDIDYGVEILKDDFTVKLPVISIALLKQIIEIWKPLLDDNVISMATMLNILPGINPSEETKLIQKEREEKAKNSPFQNQLINNTMNNIRGQDENGNQINPDEPVV